MYVTLNHLNVFSNESACCSNIELLLFSFPDVLFSFISYSELTIYSSHTYTTVNMAITSKDFSITGKLGAS